VVAQGHGTAGNDEHRYHHSRSKRKAVDDSANRERSNMKNSEHNFMGDGSISNAQDYRPIFGGTTAANGNVAVVTTDQQLLQQQQQQQQQQQRGSCLSEQYVIDHHQMLMARNQTSTGSKPNENLMATTDHHLWRSVLSEQADQREMMAQDKTSVALTAADPTVTKRCSAAAPSGADFPDISVSESDSMPTARQEEIYQRTLRLLKQKERQHSTLEMALSHQATTSGAPLSDPQGPSSLPTEKKVKTDTPQRKDPPVATTTTTTVTTTTTASNNNNNNNTNSNHSHNMYLPDAALLAAVAVNTASFPGGTPLYFADTGHTSFSAMDPLLGSPIDLSRNLLDQQQRLFAYLSAPGGNYYYNNNDISQALGNNNVSLASSGINNLSNNNHFTQSSANSNHYFAQQALANCGFAQPFSGSIDNSNNAQASAKSNFAQLTSDGNNFSQASTNLAPSTANNNNNNGGFGQLTSANNNKNNNNNNFAQPQPASALSSNVDNSYGPVLSSLANNNFAQQASALELIMAGLPAFTQPIIQNTGTNVFFCNNFSPCGGATTAAAGAGQLGGGTVNTTMLPQNTEDRPIRESSIRDGSSNDGSSNRNNNASSRDASITDAAPTFREAAIQGAAIRAIQDGSTRNETASDEKEESSWSSTSDP
jgi:hypothetical protein